MGALLTSMTVEQAATTAGVGERTVRRWLADPTSGSLELLPRLDGEQVQPVRHESLLADEL